MIKTNKYYSVELLRFMTALAVLIFHYQHFFFPYHSLSKLNILENINMQPFYEYLNFFYNFGNNGVPMFWTISGFVFAHVYLEKNIDIKEYFINRFSRLYPLHFFTLIVVSFIQFLNIYFINNFQIYQNNDIYHFLLNFFFISSWGLEKGFSFNNPIWSVSVEVLVYLIFYFTITFIKKYNFKFLILFSIILFILDQSSYNFFFSKCARLFFYGIIIYKINLLKISKQKLTILSLIFLIIGLKTGLKTFLVYPSILLFFVSIESYFFKFNKAFEILGNQTYSMYLLHVPVQLIIIFIFNYFSLNNILFLKNTFFVMYILTIMLMSHFCFKYFENTSNIYLRNFFKKSY